VQGQGSDEAEGVCSLTDIGEDNSAIAMGQSSPETSDMSGAVAPSNIDLQTTTSGGTEATVEAPGHHSGPSHNEDSDSSHSDDDEKPLLS